MISYTYAAGVIGTMLGWIQMLRHIKEPSIVPLALAVSLLTIFYSIIISECVLRPVARRVEDEIEK
jgi:flagellar motor component MotA